MIGKITGKEYGRIATLKGMGRTRKFSGKFFECVASGFDPYEFDTIRKRYSYSRVTKTGIDAPYELWARGRK